MDGLTDESIWGGLGNLRFLQVKIHLHTPLLLFYSEARGAPPLFFNVSFRNM